MNIRKNYGYYLTGKRIEQGLTVKNIAEKSGVSSIKIDNIERENAEGFSLYDLNKYLEALNIPLSEIMPEDGILFECKKGEIW